MNNSYFDLFSQTVDVSLENSAWCGLVSVVVKEANFWIAVSGLGAALWRLMVAAVWLLPHIHFPSIQPHLSFLLIQTLLSTAFSSQWSTLAEINFRSHLKMYVPVFANLQRKFKNKSHLQVLILGLLYYFHFLFDIISVGNSFISMYIHCPLFICLMFVFPSAFNFWSEL